MSNHNLDSVDRVCACSVCICMVHILFFFLCVCVRFDRLFLELSICYRFYLENRDNSKLLLEKLISFSGLYLPVCWIAKNKKGFHHFSKTTY